jgi:glycosyltransferase involved in cell wall biosynthesis
MSEFYKSIDVYVCASIKEGHNNCLIEAASSGNAIITTLNGTVPEYLKNEDSALIVDRETKPFMTAVKKLQDDLELVANLGKSARHAVLYNFDWKDRALDYKKLFERALNEL